MRTKVSWKVDVDKVEQLMRQKGFTKWRGQPSRTKLAKAAGVADTTLIRIWYGDNRDGPTLDTIYKIANALGVDISDILAEDAPPR